MKNGCETVTISVCNSIDCDWFVNENKKYPSACKYHGNRRYGPVNCTCEEAIKESKGEK